jgi:small subunit ribosomal protein S6
MIYETAYVLRPDANEEAIKKIKENVSAAIKEFGGEVLVEDDWGVKQFAQPTHKGETKGHYLYAMYKAEKGDLNSELERRFRIAENVLKFIFIQLGDDADQEKIVAAYKNPNNTNTEAGRDLDKDRKMFSRRKSCWFSAKKVSPDWKDPSTYSWLVNEFGKISPARVTGLRPKFQRSATTAIKRGRAMGLISYMSNHTFR